MSRSSTAVSTGTLPLVGLLLAHFTNDLYANFLPSFLPVLKSTFELNYTMTAVLLSTFHAAGSFLQIGFGWLADRWPAVPFALIGPLVTGAFMSLVGVMPSYALVVVALLGASLGTAAFHPSGAAGAGQLGGARRGLAVSLFVAGGTVGFALGPALMGLFIDRWGVAQSPLALLPLAALGTTFWLCHWPFRSASTADGTTSRSPRLSLRRPDLPWAPLARLWGLVVLRHTVHLGVLGFVVILLETRGLDYLAGNLALFGFVFMAALGGIAGGYVSDRWGRWPVTVGALTLGMAATLGFLASSGAVSLLLLLLGGGLLNASNPVIVTQAQELLPAQTGTASAVVMGFAWGMASLLVNVVGVLADAWSSVGWALGAVTLSALILTVLLTLRRPAALQPVQP